MKINIKPLSVNEAWKGRRFKTDKYKNYEKEVLLFLEKIDIPEGKLQITLKWGFSNSNSDWDNPIKPIQDILQAKYGFNDKRIYKGIVDKYDVEKGKEFIEFEIEKLNR